MRVKELFEVTSKQVLDSEDDIIEKMKALVSQSRTEKQVLGTHRFVKTWTKSGLWSFDVKVFGNHIHDRSLDINKLYNANDEDDEVAAKIRAKIQSKKAVKKATKYQEALFKFLSLVKDNPHGWEFVGYDEGYGPNYSRDPVDAYQKLNGKSAFDMPQGCTIRVLFKLEKK